MKTYATAILIIAIIKGLTNQGFGQLNEMPTLNADPHLPGRDKVSLGFITTYSGFSPPPVFIMDVTYGISKKVAIGLVGATTGALALYGLKVNAQLLRWKNWRLVFRMTSIYYPKRSGKFLFDRKEKYVMPWMLGLAVVDAEWRLGKNRLSLGLGILETHCVDDMKNWFGHSGEFHHINYPDFFQTIQTSFSIPLSKRVLLRPEVIAVMRSGRLIDQDRFKVPFPINPYINLIVNLSKN